MKTKSIITISRQFGSGGRAIGKAIAKELDISYYDKELIEMAARESGMDVAEYERESTKTSRAFYVLGAINYTLGSPISVTPEMSVNDRLYNLQSQMIANLADQGPCVIVGRCADSVLEERSNVINIYFHANMKDRMKRTIEEYGVGTEDEIEDIEDFIQKIDKQRANYYHYYTNKKWGKCENYNLSIDTSKFSVPQILSMIKCVLAMNK